MEIHRAPKEPFIKVVNVTRIAENITFERKEVWPLTHFIVIILGGRYGCCDEFV